MAQIGRREGETVTVPEFIPAPQAPATIRETPIKVPAPVPEPVPQYEPVPVKEPVPVFAR